MLKLNDQFNSVSFLDKVRIGKLNFYPIKFDLKEIPKNLKNIDCIKSIVIPVDVQKSLIGISPLRILILES